MGFPSLTIGDIVAKVPIIQGGMGVGISLHRLAGSVAAEGGIGVIAGAMIGMRQKDVARDPINANRRALAEEIQKARQIAPNGVIGVNIMVVLSDFASLVKTSIKEGADIIFSGAGLPLELPKYFKEVCEETKKEFKTKLVPIVSSARAASLLCRKWLNRFDYLPDAFVVEGPKAGGHLGFKAEDLDNVDYSLEKLIPEVVEAVKVFEIKYGKKIPVIAAGGVFTGGDIHKFFSLGASGVQMGTRFVATEECDADIRFKQAYVDATEEDIAIIKSPVGMPGRALNGDFVKNIHARKKKFHCMFHCITTCHPETSPYCIAGALISAMKGNLKTGFAFAGKNVHRIQEITTVKKLIDSLQTEFDEVADTKQIESLQKSQLLRAY